MKLEILVQVHNRAETGDATVLGARAGFETEGLDIQPLWSET